jgi:hypothetical protein
VGATSGGAKRSLGGAKRSLGGAGFASTGGIALDGTVDGVRSLFASGCACRCVAVSGRTDTGGGVLVDVAGRGGALTVVAR